MSSNTEITMAELKSYRAVWRASKRRTVADMIETLRRLYEARQIEWMDYLGASGVIGEVSQSAQAQGLGITRAWCSYDGGVLVPEDAEVPEDMLTPVPGEHATYTPTAVFLEGVDSQALRDKAMREARIYLTVDGDNDFHLRSEGMPFCQLYSPSGQHVPSVVERAVESYVAHTERLGHGGQAYWLLTNLPETLSVDWYKVDDVIDVLSEEIEDDLLDAAISVAKIAVRELVHHGEHPTWEQFSGVVRRAAGI